MDLTREQLDRYSRHVLLPQIGVEGQKRLLGARVLIIGAGGLGSPAAIYLAAAGIGTIGIIDSDTVEISNLQRQILHTTETAGRPKLTSAQARIHSLNPDVRFIAHNTRLDSTNALDIIGGYDIVVDGSDNFPTRYLSNDACVLLDKPNIYGAIHQFQGQASVFLPRKGPCYRCLFPEPPSPGSVPTCAEAGVLGVLPGVIGLLQATETIKLILGLGGSLAGRLLLYDALEMQFRTVNLRRDPLCPVCGDYPTVTTLIDYEAFCIPHGSRAIHEEISASELQQRLRRGERLLLVDVRNPDEHTGGHIRGSRPIPLPEFPERLHELEPHRHEEFVVYCQKGGRSAKACALLKQAGFENVKNLRGGYSEWVNQGDE